MKDSEKSVSKDSPGLDFRTGRRKPLGVRIWRFVRAVLIAYLLILLLMMLLENKLIFPARKYPHGDWEPDGLHQQPFDFTSADGTKLHGWYVEHPEPKAHVLFCHGNAEHVADLAGLLKMYHDDFEVSIFAFDYRGYGRSEGKPNEAGVLADAHAAQAWLADHAGIGQDEIVIVGRSLGGGVAVELAATNGARGLVLERTFSSLPDVAASAYPWLPVRLLMKSRMDSLGKIENYSGPLLQSHGTADRVVPYEAGQKLFEAAPSPDKRFVSVKGGGHNDPYAGEYLIALDEFLATLPPN